MEMTQVILVVSVGVLTVVLALVGFQIFQILREFKRSVEKINKILEDMGKVSENMTKPTSSFSGVFFGLKTGLKVLKLFMERKKKKKENE